MIDIHCHILPGLDDGAVSMDEALMMAEQAVKSGTRAIACSVHSNQRGRYENYESPELKSHFERLTDALCRENIPLTLVRGMEIYATEDLTELIRDHRLISLNRSGNYLVEFGFLEDPVVMDRCIQRLVAAGIQTVIAHPERYVCVQEDPNLLYEWRKMGVYAQLNKNSIFGVFGREEAKCAQVLLEHQLISCIASDAHGTQFRTTDMTEIRHFLQRNYSEEAAELLLHSNPSRILMGRSIPDRFPPRRVVTRRRYF